MKKTIFGLISTLGLTVPVPAADLAVQLTDQNGRPVEHAVVSLTPKFAMGAQPEMAGKAEMRQQGTMFSPFVLPVSVGTTVSFPNFDEFRHQVYSFSKPKRFELRLYGQDESKTIHFDKPGVVALGCNIHDNMLAYVYISDAPIVAASNEKGEVTFTGLEAGAYDMTYWHPDISDDPGTSDGPGAGKAIDLRDDAPTSVEASLSLRSIRSVQRPPSDEEYN